MNHILTLIVFTPLLGAAALLLAPRGKGVTHKYVAAMTCSLTFFLSCLLVAKFDGAAAGVQFLERHEWISSLRISYALGVDGLSIVLLPLSALLFLLGVIASWDRSSGVKGYFALFLILETSILGVLAAQDLFLFVAFWEAALLPVYFMIGVWGARQREYAATKFFLYQMAGSACLILGVLAIYYSVEPHHFSIIDLAGTNFSDARLQFGDRSLRLDNFVFLLMLAGFAVRLPIVPFHSWFPHVQAEAPAALAVVIAAVFIKTGAYALLRINYALFPEASREFAPLLAVFGVVNVLYGGFGALAQRDIRRLVAYACISHMGFVLLGLGIFSAAAMHGSLLQMEAHAVYGALLFFLIGILGARSGQHQLTRDDGSQGFGGLVGKAPLLTGFFTVAVFSALGVPGLGAFPSECLVFLGSFPTHRTLTILGLAGLFLTAGYMLWMYRRLFLGPAGPFSADVTDVSVREQLYLVPLVVLCVFVGTYPTPLLNLAETSVGKLLVQLSGAAGDQARPEPRRENKDGR